MHSQFLTVVVLLLALGAFAGAPSAVAQGIDESEVQEAIEGMRAAGMPESQIEKFIESVANARKAAEIIESGEASFGITPHDAERMSMDRKRREFEAEHGDKPDAIVSIGPDRHTLKIVECQGDSQMYSVVAMGPPAERQLHLYAGRSSIGTTGVQVRVGHDTSYDLERGSASHFDGRRLSFDGELEKSREAQPTGERIRVQVDATCR